MNNLKGILKKIKKEIPEDEDILSVEYNENYPAIDMAFGQTTIPCVVITTHKNSRHAFACSTILEEFLFIKMFARKRAKEIIAKLNPVV